MDKHSITTTELINLVAAVITIITAFGPRNLRRAIICLAGIFGGISAGLIFLMMFFQSAMSVVGH
ncbi:MAG TPA: hypothetical protein VMT20_25490 [Terriglobia bacterium]|nr:hypothetical protein [Terriglobia bacterium]